MSDKYEKELNIAVEASVVAGDFLRRRENLIVDSQEGKDIKLAADRQSEDIIIDRLSDTGIAILSEERGLIGDVGGDGYRWIVDPIDGTANYYRGLDDLSCVSIALWKGDRPVLGVINRFVNGDIFTAVVGSGAYLNNKPIRVSSVKNIEQAVIATGFPVKGDYSTEALAGFVSRIQRFKKVRMLGSAALMGVFVACGLVDSYAEDNIMLWDIAAAAAIVLAAGGVVENDIGEGNKCKCRLFATRELAEVCHAEGI
jgi:myo-inositol-1(or 4)-monophosphatase